MRAPSRRVYGLPRLRNDGADLATESARVLRPAALDATLVDRWSADDRLLVPGDRRTSKTRGR
jgi:hypothetical protein